MKFALIGSYGHADSLLGGIAASADVELAAVARYGPDDKPWFIGQHPAAPASLPVFDDYRVMLDEVRPDAVGVFMPLYRNAGVSIEAARRGCHIISEKPLATTHEDLTALRQAVSDAGVQCVALLSMRALPAYQAVRGAVAAGRIGRPVLACGQKSYPFDQRDDYYKSRETYGGTIPWQAIHAIDFVSYCAGRDFSRVAAMNANSCHPTHPGMEDNGGLLFEFRGGGHAVIAFDYLRPWGLKGRSWGDDRLRIAGSDAAIEIMDQGKRVELMTPAATEDIPLAPAQDFLREFLAQIDGRPADPLVTMEESFRMTEVALKVRDAADEGKVVAL